MPYTQKKKPIPAPDRLLGRTLHDGEYEVQRVLGIGGMGKVYLVHHTNLKAPFALKQIPADQSLPESVIQELDAAVQAGEIQWGRHPSTKQTANFPSSGGVQTDHFL